MKLNSILAVAVALISLNAQAAGEWRTGVAGGTTTFLASGGTNSAFNYTASTPAIWNIGLNADYGHTLTSNLQLLGIGGLGYMSIASTPAASVLTYTIMAGLRYNFSEKIQESMYIQAALGLVGTSPNPGTGTSTIGWQAGIGNRYKMTESVSFAPEVGVTSTTATGAVMSIYAKLANFAIWF